MKKLLLTIGIFILAASTILAQAPHSFKYQAIARDGEGNILSNQNVSLRISLLQGDIAGKVVYSEYHNLTTNQYGLINLEIGNGKNKTGDISSIHWSVSKYYVNIEIDINAGTDYKSAGASQLLSVPYALYAENSGVASKAVVSIDDLSDASSDATNLFLGSGAGHTDDGNNQNVGVGISALETNEVGIKNTAVGYYALYYNEASHNTAVGWRALDDNTEGESNTAIGELALDDNTYGNENTGLGMFALTNNTTGDYNTACGYAALDHNDTSSFNTAVGRQAAGANIDGNFNTAVGFCALHYNESGTCNTIIGTQAGSGSSTTDQSENVFVGFRAGYSVTNGSDKNVYLGYKTGHNSTGEGNIFIGYKAGYYETGDDKLYISTSSGSDIATGKTAALIYGEFDRDIVAVNRSLGIGTTNPVDELHVIGSIRMVDGTQGNGYVMVSDANGTGSWVDPSTFNDGDWTISGNDMYSSISGNVGIGSSSPNVKLDVIGAATFNGTAGSAPLSINNNNIELTVGRYVAWSTAGIRGLSDGGYHLGFRTNNIEQMRITEDGKVGIGTYYPVATLSVDGGVQIGNSGVAPSSSTVGTIRYRADTNDSTIEMIMQTDVSTYSWVVIHQNTW